ncbi:MAG TPA: hypothetical protein DCY13_13040 [Verrucomicrobiales bacterium]|nr:hypothetical protein [Verrucomicrobiales bacterium]
MADPQPRQAVTTTVFGSHAEMLDRTFTSFAVNPDLELHAFVIGEALPEKQAAGVNYHLVRPQHTFSLIYREVNYRRWEVIDQLGVDYVAVVDGIDVLCLQRLPPLREILNGSHVAAAVEHNGGRFMFGPQYTATYLNAGVSFWDLQASRDIRAEILERGRTRFRSKSDDQHTFNEVLHRHFGRLRVLTYHYNCRAVLKPRAERWPRITSLDGVRIYHTDDIDAAKSMMPVKPVAELEQLEPDPGPLTPRQQFWRNLRNRFRPHRVK